jgi:AcrR family transcriptional regulator
MGPDPGTPPIRERADAARNRARVLDAAARLLAADPAGTTMEQIARAAGVGKGTLYRRYPDRTAIAVALLDEHERDLQARLLAGPAPPGPGAPPAARLAAFYAAFVEHLEAHGHLARAVEHGAERLRTGAHDAWRQHVAMLVREAGLPGDANVLAEPLLAPLDPELYAFQRQQLGRSPAELVAALEAVARILGH